MKILLTTIVDNINFGTYLQAFATVYILRKRNSQVEILNYVRPYLDGRYYAKRILKDKESFIIKRLVRSVGYYLLNGYMIWNLKRFLSKRVSLTTKITKIDEIVKKFSGKYDLYLTGSDQVWNTQHNFGVDPIFFFKGISGEKVSYASSIGIDSFNPQDRIKIKQMISEYRYISVRESSGVKLLNEIGIENVNHVLDPTLMITSEEWIKICQNKFKKYEKYLLIYSVEVSKNNEVYQAALRIAEEKHLKVYLICPTLKFKKDFPMVDRLFSLANVDLFISLFYNADYIVCSSFHGTAFSINFNKQFISIAPERFNSRVVSLLNLLGISNRYVRDIGELPSEKIDYSRINGILEKERVKSNEFLDKLVGNQYCERW